MEQVLRDYEMVFIAVPQLEDQALAALNERVVGRITSASGAVTGTRVWGRQKLAYQVRKQNEGIYVQVNFQLAPSACRDLERNLRLDEEILRFLIVRPDEG